MRVRFESGTSIELPSKNRKRLTLLKLTTACNLTCTNCWYSINPQLLVPLSKQMNFNKLSQVLKAIELGTEDFVYVSGGEPTIRPDCEEICRLLIATGAKVYLTTNGTRTKQLQQLSDCVSCFVISLDSVRRTYHDMYRGCHEETLRSITTLARHHRVCVTMTLSKQNLDDLVSLAIRCDELGVSSFFYQLLWLPTYHKDRRRRCIDTTSIDILKRNFQELYSTDMEMQLPPRNYASLVVECVRNDGNKVVVHDCFGLTNYLHIDPVGNLSRCVPHDILNSADLAESQRPVVKMDLVSACEFFSEECCCLMGHYLMRLN